MKPALVVVFLNGLPIYVPRVVGCYFAFRGALGVARGVPVSRERAGRRFEPPTIHPIDFPEDDPWEFVSEERYVTGPRLAGGGPAGFAQAEELEPWQRPDDWWKGS